jgi:phosphatidylinositol alpha-1,6-mannosyltransferase
MRLLLLTIDFPPGRGGVQTLLAQLATGLARTWDVVVVTPAAAGDQRWDAAQVYAVRRSRPAAWGLAALVGLHARALVELLRRRPDVLVCGHVLLGPFCRLVSALLRVPYVAMAYAYEIRAPRLRPIAGLALRGARRVVTISEFSRRAVQAHGVAPASVVVVHPGAVERAPATTSTREPASGRVVLTVGRLVDGYKGHDMVIRAMPLILARVPGVRYVVVGDGPRRAYLERLAVAHGVSHAVRFVGEVSDDEVDAWYRRCDVFVLAGRESDADGGAEGYGIACVEASLRGKPVVGGRSGGIPDAVVDGETGMLVDPLDPADIADAVTRLLAEPELAARLGRAGRRRALDELAWSRVTERMSRVLAQAAAG